MVPLDAPDGLGIEVLAEGGLPEPGGVSRPPLQEEHPVPGDALTQQRAGPVQDRQIDVVAAESPHEHIKDVRDGIVPGALLEQDGDVHVAQGSHGARVSPKQAGEAPVQVGQGHGKPAKGGPGGLEPAAQFAGVHRGRGRKRPNAAHRLIPPGLPTLPR